MERQKQSAKQTLLHSFIDELTNMKLTCIPEHFENDLLLCVLSFNNSVDTMISLILCSYYRTNNQCTPLIPCLVSINWYFEDRNDCVHDMPIAVQHISITKNLP